jgi:hypothetical protein
LAVSEKKKKKRSQDLATVLGVVLIPSIKEKFINTYLHLYS